MYWWIYKSMTTQYDFNTQHVSFYFSPFHGLNKPRWYPQQQKIMGNMTGASEQLYQVSTLVANQPGICPKKSIWSVRWFIWTIWFLKPLLSRLASGNPREESCHQELRLGSIGWLTEASYWTKEWCTGFASYQTVGLSLQKKAQIKIVCFKPFFNLFHHCEQALLLKWPPQAIKLSLRQRLQGELEVFLSLDHPHIARLLYVPWKVNLTQQRQQRVMVGELASPRLPMQWDNATQNSASGMCVQCGRPNAMQCNVMQCMCVYTGMTCTELRTPNINFKSFGSQWQGRWGPLVNETIWDRNFHCVVVMLDAENSMLG